MFLKPRKTGPRGRRITYVYTKSASVSSADTCIVCALDTLNRFRKTRIASYGTSSISTYRSYTSEIAGLFFRNRTDIQITRRGYGFFG